MKRTLLCALCASVVMVTGCSGMADVLTVTLRGRSGLGMPPQEPPAMVERDRQLTAKAVEVLTGDERPTVQQMQEFLLARSRVIGQPKAELTDEDVPQAVKDYKERAGAFTTAKAAFREKARIEAAKPSERGISIQSGMLAWLIRIGGAGILFAGGMAVYQWIKRKLAERAAKATFIAIDIAKAANPVAYLAEHGLKAALTDAHTRTGTTETVRKLRGRA